METAAALKGHIKKALEARKMSILTLSQVTGIPYSTLQHKLSRKPQNITMEELGDIAAGLHLSPVDLMTGNVAVMAVAA